MTSLPRLPGSDERGVIARLVRNGVTPNLLMFVFLAGGLFVASQVKQEVFPEFEMDTVTISVAYPGASPEEVERGILLSVEEAVRGLDGVRHVRSTAAEGSGRVTAELETSADAQRIYQDVQQQVNRIRTFPQDAERPVITLDARRREVLSVIVYGSADEHTLRALAEQVQDRLLQRPGVTQVELTGAPTPEVHVEVSTATLRSLGLTLDEIAQRVRANALEVPGGTVEAEGGEVLLRVRERRDWAREFATLPLVAAPQGALLRLGDVADVSEGLEEVDLSSHYDGHPAVAIEVYRVGDETPLGVSQAVRAAMREIAEELPDGVRYAIQRDRSEIYQQRLDLLRRNGLMGLLLVFVVLALFLEVRLAWWVTLGIPTAFLGAFLFLPLMGVTINMISLFAFIIALGIVVDDAIVSAESVHQEREAGHGPMEAAIRGARAVASPIGISILTNVAAFLPLLFVPGTFGKTWRSIPLVVSAVFLVSWVESLLILPSHLAHARSGRGNPWTRMLRRGQEAFARAFARFVQGVYRPVVLMATRWRYLTVASMLAVLAVVVSWAFSGRLGFVLMPSVESDRAIAVARLPYGSPPSRTAAVRDRLVAAAQKVWQENGGERLASGVLAEIREHVVEATVYLTEPEVRPIGTAAFTELWREALGDLPGVESVRLESDRGGPGGGAAITVEIRHSDIAVLDRASADLAASLEAFESTRDVDDGYTPGKRQLDFALLPEARQVGLDAQELARQVRAAFQGSIALRLQRGRSEVKVLVRLPREERVTEHSVERMLLRTPAGAEIPLLRVATTAPGRAYTSIDRRDGRRAVTITADVTRPAETQRVLEVLKAETLPALVRAHPGLTYDFEGRQAELRESLDSLLRGLLLAVFAIYVLVAIPFRSYVQPIIVMLAIPFGVVGAILGHAWMGYELSIISLMGTVALSGVVVNDSIVMVDLANRFQAEGMRPRDAIREAGLRRFRPILLTTLTTFGGLAPMIFETSRQARFMIPMAISLGYGILFATAITLLLLPALYAVLEDVRGAFRRRVGRRPG